MEHTAEQTGAATRLLPGIAKSDCCTHGAEQGASVERVLDWREACGAWMFRNRSWLPVPLATGVVLFSRRLHLVSPLVISGVAIETIGEALRLWAIRHIGTISRTRAQRIGPLITSGPYAFVRNPLYVGNCCLWTGVVICSGVLWMLPIAWLVFGVQYALMVGFEERLLRIGHADYDDYRRDVPAWLPSLVRRPHNGERSVVREPWRAVLVSERSTLLAIVVMGVLLLWR